MCRQLRRRVLEFTSARGRPRRYPLNEPSIIAVRWEDEPIFFVLRCIRRSRDVVSQPFHPLDPFRMLRYLVLSPALSFARLPVDSPARLPIRKRTERHFRQRIKLQDRPFIGNKQMRRALNESPRLVNRLMNVLQLCGRNCEARVSTGTGDVPSEDGPPTQKFWRVWRRATRRSRTGINFSLN